MRTADSKKLEDVIFLRKMKTEQEASSRVERICRNCRSYRNDACYVKGSQAACEIFVEKEWAGYGELVRARCQGAY